MEPSKRSNQTALEADAEGRGVVQQLFLLGIACRCAGDGRQSAVRQPLRQRACEQPLVLRKSRETSTILMPFQVMHRRFLSVTVATTAASRFSLAAAAIKRVYVLCTRPRQPCAPATRRWPARCRPDRRTSSVRRSGRCPDRRPARRWQRDTPPAPKSLQRLIIRVTLRVAEQTLELALLGRVALLYLRAAGFQRFRGVRLGGAGCTAAAVAPGLAARAE